MVRDETTVALVGAGGYGDHFYLRELLGRARERGLRLVAVVDPQPDRCGRRAELEAAGIPFHPDLDTFLAAGQADLVIVAAPIHWHAPLTVRALAAGASVLCEKPLCATLPEARTMLEAEARCAGRVAVGYQWSFSEAIQQLKQDVCAGRFGRPRRFKTIVLWPRSAAYYGRNNWAGALRAPDGRWVLDSPVNNATAHFLHNMLYILGPTPETAATPVEVQAELYRANPIQTFDTAALRCRTADGVEICFYTSHAIPGKLGPVCCYEFDQAVVAYAATDRGGRFRATFSDGRTRDYGDPEDGYANKLWQAAAMTRTGEPPCCGIRAATAQTLCVNGVHQSMTAAIPFPADRIRRTPHVQNGQSSLLTWVDGLAATLNACFEQGCLPSECGAAAWARAGRIVDPRGGTP